ncbi:MAG TPA: AAA family ATPase [Anaerolineae bacterium]|nr:AAA family ATPase [Anaerolineae bacterium]
MLRVQLLGTPRLTWEEQPINIPRRAVRAALYYLAAQPTPVSREALAFLFWADSPEAMARSRLRRMLSQLRQALQAGGAPVDLLRVEDDYVLLDRQRRTVDVIEFERELQAARSATQPDQLTALGERALAHYRGEFLLGFTLTEAPAFNEWLSAERERLARRYLDLLLLLGQHYRQLNDVAHAQHYAETVLRLDPLCEEAHVLLLECFAARGERAAALRQYELLREALERELHVPPLPETTERYQQLLNEMQRPSATSAPSAIAPTSDDVPFVGRTIELSALHDRWQRVHHGHGQAALIMGVAGQGKTRLMAEFVRQVQGEARVLAGACYPSMLHLPYYPIVEALRPELEELARTANLQLWQRELLRLLPEAAESSAGLPIDPAGQARLLEAISRFLRERATARPVIVVVNDVHWADDNTLMLLAYLTRRLVSTRVMWIASLQSEEADRLRAWRDELRREDNVTSIELAPFDETQVHTLIRQVSGLTEGGQRFSRRLYQDTEGNPFFLIQMLRQLLEAGLVRAGPQGWQTSFDAITEDYGELSLPETVRAVIQARVARLSSLAQQVTGVAAVLGREFNLDLLQRVANCSEVELIEALEELLHAHMIREGQSIYQFTHGKFREVIYEELSAARRQALHRRVVTALLANPQRTRLSAEVAYHAERGEWWEPALEFAQQAAREAGAVYAYEDVAAFESQAWQALEHLPDQGTRRIEILLQREAAYHALGRRDDQVHDLEILRQLITPVGDAELQAQWHLRRGRWLVALSRWAEAEAELQQASLAAEAATAREAQLLLATCQGNLNRFAEAEQTARAALEIATAHGQLDAQATCALTLAELNDLQQQYEQAKQWLEPARVWAEQIADRTLQARVLYLTARMEFQVGQYPAARHSAEQGRALYGRMGYLAGEADCLRVFAMASARSLMTQDAIAAYELARRYYHSVGQRYGLATIELNLSALFLRLGDFERGQQHSRAAVELFTAIGHLRGQCAASSNLGQALVWQGRGAEAEPWFIQAEALAGKLNLIPWRAEMLSYLGRALLLQDRVAEAEAAMRRGLEVLGDQAPYHIDSVIEQAWLALVCLRADRVAEAEEISRSTVAELRARPGAEHPQQVYFVHALVLHAQGDQTGAAAALTEASLAIQEVLAALDDEADRQRYLTQFAFNRFIQAAQQGQWPVPPRLL